VPKHPDDPQLSELDRTRLEALGRHIYVERHKKHMTQEELADQLGVGTQAVIDMEKGRRNFPVLRLADLADIFGLTPREMWPE
jgi:DNA-binding XRE family transcriptional regulator